VRVGRVVRVAGDDDFHARFSLGWGVRVVCDDVLIAQRDPVPDQWAGTAWAGPVRPVGGEGIEVRAGQGLAHDVDEEVGRV